MMNLTWFVGIVCILLGPYSIGEAKSLKRVERHAQVHNLQSWNGVDGALKHVSVGRAGVWGVNCKDMIYYREDTYDDEHSGRVWIQTDGRLAQVDVGRDVVWGVNSNQDIYYRDGIWEDNPLGDHWVHVEGKLTHVSVSQRGHVWGVNVHDCIFHRIGACLNNPRGNNWKGIDGKLKQISVGASGVWGVNNCQNIYYRVGTYGDPECDPNGTGWTQVAGKLVYISSAEFVYGVNSAGNIYSRQGVCSSNPVGTHWEHHHGSLKQIESLSLMVWGVNKHHKIYEKDQDWGETDY